MIHGCLNGGTRMDGLHASAPERIGRGGEPGELKHLSSRRKGKKEGPGRDFDSGSSGERNRKSPNRHAGMAGFGLRK